MILQLQDYDMEIISRPGTANANADALSRLPELLENRNTVVHFLSAVVTRSSTSSLPPAHRTGVDPDLALDPAAYDLDLALYESQYEPSQFQQSEKKEVDNSDGGTDDTADDPDIAE